MLRPVSLVLVEAIYLVVYVAVAIISSKGVSPSDSCPLFLAPIPTWFLLIVALIVSEDVGTLRNRVIFVLAMTSHYFITIVLVLGAFGDTYPRYFASYFPGHVSVTLAIIGWYLLGQAFHWANYIYKLRLQ